MYEERFGFKKIDGVAYREVEFFDTLANSEDIVHELSNIDVGDYAIRDYLSFGLPELNDDVPAGCVKIFWGPYDEEGAAMTYERFVQLVKTAVDIWLEKHRFAPPYTLEDIDRHLKSIEHRYENGIVKVDEKSAEAVFEIAQKTIAAVYPHYYPRGAVEFFSKHHCIENIREDFKKPAIFLYRVEGKPVGTVTVHENEISRLFVLPEYQGKGYGKALLDFAEELIWEKETYDRIRIDASLPAKRIYLKRGYKEVEYNIIEADGDYLCYDVMEL